jgi:hypothetical protein
MRVTIRFDSASTEAVREMAAALHNVGLTGTLRVGLNGPEAWSGETPPLTSAQWTSVATRLVKYQGQPLADAIRDLEAALTGEVTA